MDGPANPRGSTRIEFTTRPARVDLLTTQGEGVERRMRGRATLHERGHRGVGPTPPQVRALSRVRARSVPKTICAYVVEQLWKCGPASCLKGNEPGPPSVASRRSAHHGRGRVACHGSRPASPLMRQGRADPARCGSRLVGPSSEGIAGTLPTHRWLSSGPARGGHPPTQRVRGWRAWATDPIGSVRSPARVATSTIAARCTCGRGVVAVP
jgi:hypothetical protein